MLNHIYIWKVVISNASFSEFTRILRPVTFIISQLTKLGRTKCSQLGALQDASLRVVRQDSLHQTQQGEINADPMQICLCNMNQRGIKMFKPFREASNQWRPMKLPILLVRRAESGYFKSCRNSFTCSGIVWRLLLRDAPGPERRGCRLINHMLWRWLDPSHAERNTAPPARHGGASVCG